MNALAARARWLIAGAPLLVLGASFVNAPYLTAVREVAGAPDPLTSRPHALYRHDSTRFYYTSADLIHPDAFGPPGFIEAVVFDVLPAGANTSNPDGDEPDTASNTSLMWVSRFGSALAVEPAPSPASDVDLAERFRTEVGGPARVSRGGVTLFDVPPASTYRRTTGVRALAAIATRPAPGADADPLGTGERGSPQLFDEALDGAFQGLRRRGIRSVGVPRMVVRDRIGRSGSRAESWETIIARADEAARKSGMQRVLFGGWGIDPRARAATDAAFRGVWERQRRVLERQTREIADERVRVGGFLAFAALVQWVARRRSVHPLRLVALATVAGTIAVTIAAAAQWLGATFSVSPAAIFSVECAAALVAGAAIEQVVQFDPRKTVTEGVEKSA